MLNPITRLLSLLFLLLPGFLFAQLVLRVTSLPETTPAGATVYTAGSFNGWQPGQAAYALQPTQSGALEISLTLSPGNYEYKFTRGGWETVEGTAQGGVRPNRTVTYNGGRQVVEVTIAGWEDLNGGGGSSSTAADNVSILSQNFYMPQLNRQRRIWLYLPPDYETSGKSYPVLYMHDGQNLFDAATSFSGEWQVDESLNTLFAQGDPGIIVVGIDNGGGERIAEYTPWPNPTYGGGNGEAYVDFIAQTLKPHIDSAFRTRPEAEFTGIMGSSLGGLISLYAALRYPTVFGRAGVFSPSLWFTDDIYDFAQTQGHQAPQRLFLLAGEGENSGTTSVTGDLQEMYNTLRNEGFAEAELRMRIHADGRHQEWYWAREFPAAYQWLFARNATSVSDLPSLELTTWPNPVTDTLYFKSKGTDLQRVLLVDMQGRVKRIFFPRTNSLHLSTLAPGNYYLQWQFKNGRYANTQVTKQ